MQERGSHSCYQQQQGKLKPTDQQLNTWRNLSKPAPEHINFYNDQYKNKLDRRLIRDKPELRNSYIKSKGGIQVSFPFEKPYPCQEAYVRKVIKSLIGENNEGFNAMLESPTGTGKTICLLSSCVSYMKYHRENIAKKNEAPMTLIYCTRTHSQIEQVVKEIKTLLPYEVNTQVLVSKSQLCINEDIKNKYDSHTINQACKKLRQSKAQVGNGSELQKNLTKELHCACPYYLGQEIKMPEPLDLQTKFVNPLFDMRDPLNNKHYDNEELKQSDLKSKQSSYCSDIEDLVKQGKDNTLCPYYLAKSRLPSSDIIIVPYQYIIDPDLRKTLQTSLKNSIIVFDEAHNIDKQCEEILSFEINLENSYNLAMGYIELQSHYLDNQLNKDFDMQDKINKLQILNKFLKQWLEVLMDIDLENKEGSSGNHQVDIYQLSFEEFTQAIFEKLLIQQGDAFELQYEQDIYPDELVNEQGYRGGQIHETFKQAARAQNQLYKQGFDQDPFRNQTNQNSAFKQVRLSNDTIIEKELQQLIENAYLSMNIELPEDFVNCIKSKKQFRQLPIQRMLQQGKKQVNLIIDALQKMKKIRLCSVTNPQDFRGYIKTTCTKYIDEEEDDIFETRTIVSFGIMCLNPSYIFKKIITEEQPRSIILTSGTLNPMNILAQELDTEFKVILENQHIIGHQSILARIIPKDSKGNSLRFNYDHNKDFGKSQYKAVGQFIKRIVQQIQGGIIVFFTSYNHLEECQKLWQQIKLSLGAEVFQEQRDHQQTKKSYEDYSAQIEQLGKGIFLCTSRGKMSEGLNFTDNLARACLVVGIPYQLISDPRVILKKKYLDTKRREHLSHRKSSIHNCLSQFADEPQSLQQKDNNITHLKGTEWYQNQAMREVNQIIGRCIRHINDYSCIFLIDERYQDDLHRSQLCKWVRETVQVTENFETLNQEISEFFVQQQYPKQIQLNQVEEVKQQKEVLIIIDSTSSQASIIESSSESVQFIQPKTIQSTKPQLQQQHIESNNQIIEFNEESLMEAASVSQGSNDLDTDELALVFDSSSDSQYNQEERNQGKAKKRLYSEIEEVLSQLQDENSSEYNSSEDSPGSSHNIDYFNYSSQKSHVNKRFKYN